MTVFPGLPFSTFYCSHTPTVHKSFFFLTVVLLHLMYHTNCEVSAVTRKKIINVVCLSHNVIIVLSVPA